MAEFPECLGQTCWQHRLALRCLVGVGLSPTTGDAECHGRERLAKLLAPVVVLRGDARMRSPLPLPRRKIGELNRERRQCRSTSGSEIIVKSGKFVRNNSKRRTVDIDLMHGDQQELFLRRQPYQTRANKRSEE